MKKIITLLIALFLICGCSVKSTTTVSTSVSENGNTTTTTTTQTVENGVYSSSTDTVTSSDDDPTGLRNKWTELFEEGAEGVSKDGWDVYFAYDDPNDISLAAIMILKDGELRDYIFGDVVEEDGHYKIVDVDEKEDGTVENLPFEIGEVKADGFEMRFKDDDSVVLNFVDQETIINDMISIWEQQGQAYQENR